MKLHYHDENEVVNCKTDDYPMANFGLITRHIEMRTSEILRSQMMLTIV